MRDFIIAIYSSLLQFNVIVSTLGGFIIGGVIGGFSPFGPSSFSLGTAILVGAIAFFNAAIISGAALTLDRIREVLEEQSYRTREQERQQRAQEKSRAI